MKVIELKNVSKKFEITHQKRETLKENFIGFLRRDDNKKETIVALHDISFDVEEGECIGIVGENASGKTTLLKIVGKILGPTEGEIVVRGKVAPLLTLGVGFDPELTARENVYLYGSLMGLTQKQIDERYKKIVNFSELEEFMDTKLKNFSSGMTIRLGFATAINVDADILLVDEVLSVGDGAFQKKCLDKFEEFKKAGKTILYVSHGLSTIKNYCDKTIFLHKGRIRAFGDTDKVLELYRGHLSSKQLKTHNLDTLRKIHEEGRTTYIKDLKVFNDKREEHYILDSGRPFYLLFIPVNFPIMTIFTATIHREEGNITLFSKNIRKNIVMFKVDSMPLSEGTYEISIGCLGVFNAIEPHKFKISVRKKDEPSEMTRIFIENPITLNKEMLVFGKNPEKAFEELENGKPLLCFGNLEEASKTTEKGALFVNKKMVFHGSSDEVVEKYKERIFDITMKSLVKLQI